MIFLMKYGVNPDVLTYANISLTWATGTVKAAVSTRFGVRPEPTAREMYSVWC